jgi:outer membrane cobalamin receptor
MMFFVRILALLFTVNVFTAVVFSQDTTESGYHKTKKRKPVKQRVLIPERGAGIRTLKIGTEKPQLELKQEERTTKPPNYVMEAVVVTSERLENKLAFTTSSSSILTTNEIQIVPTNNFSDIVHSLPGFMVFQRDGLGRDVITTTRGFYGGGEAEYLLVYIDGVRMNNLETGLVDWNAVPVDEIAKMEIVRGPTSALYGDIAMGGVINITSKEPKANISSISLSGGSFGSRDVYLRTAGQLKDIPYRFYIQSGAMDGVRKHSGWSGTTLGGNLTVPINEQSNIVWNVSYRKRNTEDAGPLTEDSLSVNREAMNENYASDNNNENRWDSRVQYSHKIFSNTNLRTGFFYQTRDADIVRTLPIPITAALIIFDTKENQIRNKIFGFDALVDVQDTIEDIPNHFIFGGEIEVGNIETGYYNYNAKTEARGDWLSFGTGKRQHVGIFVHDEVPIIPPLKLNAGFRFDNFTDSYDATSSSNSYSAFSPKAGVNYLFATFLEDDVPVYTGNAYLNVSSSFKSPTMNQLFDQRPLFGTTISNYKLKPQRGLNFELGLYQRGRIIEKKIYGELHSSFYFNRVSDEIDFDLATFKYGNILKTTHTGTENGLRIHWIPNITAFANYTYTSAIFSEGVNQSHQLKGVPRHAASIGMTYKHRTNIAGTLSWNFTGERFFDDANTESLNSYNMLNVRISYKRKNIRAYIDFSNLLGAEFNSLGYQIGTTKFYYPHALTSIRLGIETTLNTPWVSP